MKVKDLKYKLQQIVDFLEDLPDDKDVPFLSNTYFVSKEDNLFIGVTSEGYTSLPDLKNEFNLEYTSDFETFEDYFDFLWLDTLDEYFSNYSKEAVYSAFLEVMVAQDLRTPSALAELLDNEQFGKDNLRYMIEDIQVELEK